MGRNACVRNSAALADDDEREEQRSAHRTATANAGAKVQKRSAAESLGLVCSVLVVTIDFALSVSSWDNFYRLPMGLVKDNCRTVIRVLEKEAGVSRKFSSRRIQNWGLPTGSFVCFAVDSPVSWSASRGGLPSDLLLVESPISRPLSCSDPFWSECPSFPPSFCPLDPPCMSWD
jgi:hypothetical protein